MGTLQPVLLCADVATATDADESEADEIEVLAGLPAGPGFAKLPTGQQRFLEVVQSSP